MLAFIFTMPLLVNDNMSSIRPRKTGNMYPIPVAIIHRLAQNEDTNVLTYVEEDPHLSVQKIEKVFWE